MSDSDKKLKGKRNNQVSPIVTEKETMTQNMPVKQVDLEKNALLELDTLQGDSQYLKNYSRCRWTPKQRLFKRPITTARTNADTYIGLTNDLSEESTPDHPGKDPSRKPFNSTASKAFLQHFINLANRNQDDDEVDLDHLDRLLVNGADANATDKYGQTALHEVAKCWHADVAWFLYERNADINKADKYGMTPLHVAAALNYPEMVGFLVEHGANIEATTIGEMQTPAHYSAKYDSVRSMKVLYKHKANISAQDYKQRTPLQLAAELDRSEVARLLLDYGADAGVQDHTGLCCLTLMVVNMPPVAFKALDQFHIKDKANRKQYFFLNYLQPQLLEEDSQAKTPLEVIIGYRQLDLIMHPVMQKLIEMKWESFGRKRIAIMLSLNLLFIISWTILGIASSLPREETEPYKLPDDIWRIIISIIAVGLLIYEIVQEFMEIFSSKKKFTLYKKWRRRELQKDLAFSHPRWPEEEEHLNTEIEKLEDFNPTYLKDFWNVFDWIVYFFLTVVIATHIADVSVTDNADLHTSHVRIFAVTIIFLWIRLMKHVRAIRAFGPFIVMLGKIVFDIIKFLFLYGEFYVPYACAFWIIYGGHVSNMETVHQMLFTVFRITLVDDYTFSDMYSADSIMAYVLCGTFLGLSSILCINLLIALLSDTFQRVYDNATANAVMQQASILMQAEDNLTEKKRNQFHKKIQQFCAPLTEFYDDDLTTDQEEDMRKITFQIKEELDEVLKAVRKSGLHRDVESQDRCNNYGNHAAKSPNNSSSQKQENGPQVDHSFQQALLTMQMEATAMIQQQAEALSQMRQELYRIASMIQQTAQHTAPETTKVVQQPQGNAGPVQPDWPAVKETLIIVPGEDIPAAWPEISVDIPGKTRALPLDNNKV